MLAKDSLELTDADRELICARVAAAPCERIVITHGTDTLEETAYLLDLQHASPKPVVLVPACNRVLGQHPFHIVGKKYIDAVRLAGCQPLVVPTAAADELLTREHRQWHNPAKGETR